MFYITKKTVNKFYNVDFMNTVFSNHYKIKSNNTNYRKLTLNCVEIGTHT